MKWNRIGYGTWPLAGDISGSLAYGKVNDEESKLALKCAFDNGINVYDTADFYGYGHVERLIGEVLSEYRNDIVLITKGGMISNDGKQDFSPRHLLTSFFQSLDQLKTNYIDIYMLHSPPLSILEDGVVLDLLKFLVKSNLIKEYGISLIGPNDGKEAIEKYGFKIIEVNYNLLDIRAEKNGLFELCKNQSVKVIGRTPLAQGLLTGKFQFTNDKSDRRQSWTPEGVERRTRIYKKMLLVLGNNVYTDAQNCLRFCLSNPIINVIIPGMKTENEVMENLKALTQPYLTNDEEANIKDIYEEEKL